MKPKIKKLVFECGQAITPIGYYTIYPAASGFIKILFNGKDLIVDKREKAIQAAQSHYEGLVMQNIEEKKEKDIDPILNIIRDCKRDQITVYIAELKRKKKELDKLLKPKQEG